PHYPEQPVTPHHSDQQATPHYPQQPVPAHYADHHSRPRYPDQQTQAPYPDPPAPPRYPDHHAPAHHDDQQAAPHYPELQAAPHYPDLQAPAHYRERAAVPHQDQPVPADYPVRADRRDLPAESPGDPYPNGSGTRDYSAGRPGIEGQPASARPYGHDRPGWADQQTAPGWDTGNAGTAGSELEPLPESFPYSQPHPDHELRDRQPERLRPFA
ncbi:MAG TPA: hypothetical protein VK162_10780, partial [Streptosporangiaceae bacterium]|nr:hypothetical protein [Streptosporangiaceae bacterium]